jgi:hypothetical protein
VPQNPTLRENVRDAIPGHFNVHIYSP